MTSSMILPLVLLMQIFYASSDSDSKMVTTTHSCQRDVSPNWKPFKMPIKTSHLTDFDSLISYYSDWHQTTLNDVTIRCDEKEIVVFEPVAGLGDSIGAASAAFAKAIRHGKLFFVDWNPFNWTVGFKELPFQFDYKRAVDIQIRDEPLLCACHPSSFIRGHVTSDHPINKELIVNDFEISQVHLMRGLFQPSQQVQTIINSISALGCSNSIRQVALVVRTGKGEKNRFLSDGDETNFARCFANFVRDDSTSTYHGERIRYHVIIISDCDVIKQWLASAIIFDYHQASEADKRRYDVTVATLNDSIVHVMSSVAGYGDDKTILRVQKTFAEYFVIASCDVIFLTYGSLFGKTAAERSGVTSSNVHVISDSKCDSGRNDYSYLGCHQPKFPDICRF